MKKHIFTLGIMLVFAGVLANSVSAEVSSVQDVINLYKAGDYSGCIQQSEGLVERDPSNAVLHYYRALAFAQAGNREDARQSYEKVIQLNTQETLVRYAKRGQMCLSDYEKCTSEVSVDDFIRGRSGYDITNAVKHNIETQKLEDLRRDINRNKDIDSKRLKEFKKFSYNEEGTPSNDEIVAAMQVLQRAGFAPQMAANFSDVSGLYTSSMQNSGSAVDNLMNLMSRYGNSSPSSEKIDPRLLQTMMTSQMLGL